MYVRSVGVSFVLIGAVLATSNALVSVAVALAVMSVFAFLSSSPSVF